jgi:hypothetical protein
MARSNYVAFFEKLIPYMFRPKSLMQYNHWCWGNFKFIIHEMFLYAIGVLLKHERFEPVLRLMSHSYYVGSALDYPREPMESFSIIYQTMDSLNFRNRRLNLNRLSLRAEMLEQRSHASGLAFAELMQADFVLFFFNSLATLDETGRQIWWPETLLYYREHAAPFEIFARAESLGYFMKICPLLAVKDKDGLGEAFKLFGAQNATIYLPRWDVFHSFSLQNVTNFKKLASKP